MVLKFGNHEETSDVPVTWRTRTISLAPRKSSKTASIRIHFRDMKKICVPIRYRKREDGFARADLLACLFGMFLLASVALPVLAAAGDDAKLETCRNHLKKIGTAFIAWADHHGNRMPWQVSQEDGGSYGSPSVNFAWVQFYFATNELESPKVLACPADDARVATNWRRDSEDGYLHPMNRANAVSYLVGIDSRPESPQSILSGDRNLEFSAHQQTCDHAGVKTAASLSPGDDSVQWKESVHESQGNLLFRDGSVRTTDSAALRALLPKTEAVHRDNHVLVPR